MCPESSAQVKEQTNIDTDEKPDIPESLPLNYKRDKSKVPGKKERRHSAGVGSDTLSRRSSKVVKGLQHDSKVIAEMNQQACACINMTEKRKGKTFSGKVRDAAISVFLLCLIFAVNRTYNYLCVVRFLDYLTCYLPLADTKI